MSIDKNIIEAHLNEAIAETYFERFGERKVGKVRDVYIQPERLLLIATDRYSAFDRNLCLVPFKGQVLTQLSQYWFELTKDIIPNHLLAIPDPNVMVVKKCMVVPVEVVVRGYISGVTGTSLWTLYQQGKREFGGVTLPEDMKKNQKLERPILTPTTKTDIHDEPITPADIVNHKLVSEDMWRSIEDTALALFKRGETHAKQQGLILVDTKYEFGVSPQGELMLIDEVHTPDSSRYWQASSYESRIVSDLEPENFDKEFLRLWFKENCDPYRDEKLPAAPPDMVVELSERYIQIFEQLTGRPFEVDLNRPALDRIGENILSFEYPQTTK